MPYRLKLSEPVEQGVRRIAAQQLRRTIEELSAETLAPTTVHGSRKSIKRVRALLRLVEPVISKRAFHRLNTSLRNAGRLLSGSRDGDVIEATLRQMFVDDAFSKVDRGVLRALTAKAEQVSAAAAPLTADHAKRTTDKLIKITAHIDKLRVKGKGFAALEPGLEQSYQRAKQNKKRAYQHNTDEAFHDLRKAVQWHWRQMSLLSNAWPEECQVRVALAREISQTLGRDHDLAVVRAFAKQSDVEANDLDGILLAIEQQQGVLRRSLEMPLQRLLAEKPASLARRIGAYWSGAVAASESEVATPHADHAGATPSEQADILAAPVAAAHDGVSNGSSAPRLKKRSKAERKLAAKTPGAGGSPEAS
jgi:CHAD domain-containing protein